MTRAREFERVGWGIVNGMEGNNSWDVYQNPIVRSPCSFVSCPQQNQPLHVTISTYLPYALWLFVCTNPHLLMRIASSLRFVTCGSMSH